MKIKDEAVLAKIMEGVEIDELVSWLSPEEQLVYFGWLREHGAELSPDLVLNKVLDVVLTTEQIKTLLRLGADPFLLATKLPSKLMTMNLELLIAYDLDPEKVYRSLLAPKDVIENLDELAKKGVFVPVPELAKIKALARRH